MNFIPNIQAAIYSIPCMALQPLTGHGIPQKNASIHPYFQLFSSTLVSLASVVHPSEQHPSIWFLIFPLVLCYFTSKIVLGILSSPILIICPAHPSLLILISSNIFRSFYRLYCPLFHLGRQRPRSCVGPIFSFQTYLAFVLSFVLGSRLRFHNKILA